VRVKRNAKLFHSSIEHNGFHYPSEVFFSIDKELEVEKLQWISIDNKIPVSISMNDSPTRVVWVDKSDFV
jgi:hypothetical protein